ncbi:MAG: outer membrane lipoprotein carrier protein LolA [Bacteroidales bacterium]|nr:outer membrane lipoprotein carrier protein LolA [Bacteroidales bacterium]
MKRICLILLLSLSCLPLFAQTASSAVRQLDGRERDDAIATILRANDLKTTLQFRFVMTRHSALLTEDLVSRGRAVYAYPDKVRWEVEQPRAVLFVMDGINPGDRRQQTLLRNVSKLGDKGLINETDFVVTVYASPKVWQVDLVPLRRDLSQFFTRITLLTDSRTGALSSIVLSEQSGDTTQLEFSSVVRGEEVDSALFQKP